MLTQGCARSFVGSPKADAATLTCTSLAAGTFDGPNTIERVVVMGLRPGGAWTAMVKGSGGESLSLQAAAGPLWLRKGLPEVALVVRNPGVSAFQDWQIEFTRK